MEAKDTVMKDNWLDEDDKSLLFKQAEITWDKAIREVVEWIEDTDIVVMLSPRKRREWQAQKKKWGIKSA